MDFNYQKAYCTIAYPAFQKLNHKQRNAHSKLIPLVGELSQGKDLNIPMSKAMTGILDGLSCLEIAGLSRASYFVGHWYPGKVEKPFDNLRGESWKIANVCDQILRKRLDPPQKIQIHEGKLRVTFSSHHTWTFHEFGLATEKNMEIFKTCGLIFDEYSKFNESAQELEKMCGDLWPDVDTLPDYGMYIDFLEKVKREKLAKLKCDYEKKIEQTKKDIEKAEIELKAYTWLIEKNIDMDCIYYSHKDMFCFGWINRIPEGAKEKLIDSLKDFPFKYEVK